MSDDDCPVPVQPDTKDWTWVLDRPCPECGLAAADVDPVVIGATVRGLTPRWQAVLSRPDATERPNPTTWSTCEYAAHVRDVNRIFTARLAAMLRSEDPEFANWDQDAAALVDRYDLQDPSTVAAELTVAAAALADLFDAVRPDELARSGRRSNGSRFTVTTLAQYYLHDVVHHLHDVGA